MTGNGIESDFVLPDSLFISDYSTMPAFYPHFGANCRFFCTISMLPDSSAPFCSPNATRGAASGLRQRVFDPLDSRSRDSVGDNCIQCPRVYGGTQGALPLDSAKGSSTLWTPVRAIQLSAFACCARVLIRRAKEPPLLAGTALPIVSIHSSRNICCNFGCAPVAGSITSSSTSAIYAFQRSTMGDSACVRSASAMPRSHS